MAIRALAAPQPALIEGPIIDTTNADTNESPEPLELDDFTVKAEPVDVDQDPAMAYAITSVDPTATAKSEVPAALANNDAASANNDAASADRIAAAADNDAVADDDDAASAQLAASDEAAVEAEVIKDRQPAAARVAVETLPKTQRPSVDTNPTEMEPAADPAVASAQPKLVESAPLREEVDTATVDEVVESLPQPTIVEPQPRIITAMPVEVEVATAPAKSKPAEQLAESTPIKHDSIAHDSIEPDRKSTDGSAEQGTAKVMLTPPPIMVQRQPTPAEPVAVSPIKRSPMKTASTPGVSSQRPPMESRQSTSNDRVEQDATTSVLSAAEPVFEVVKRIPLPVGSQLKTLETIDDEPTPAAKPKKTVEPLEIRSGASQPQGGLSAVMDADGRQQVKRQVLAKPEAYLAKAPVVRPDSNATAASTSTGVQLGEASVQKVQPRDEHGIIPIRKVRLHIDEDEDASVHSFSDQYPQPVHRIAPASTPKPLPRPRTDTLIKKDNSEHYPLPVRRIQLTGLTVTQ